MRPYAPDPSVIAYLRPDGGDWKCEITERGRKITWRGLDVAQVNPHGSLDDETDGQIAMSLRALPVMDAALRVIMVLAASTMGEDLRPLIQRVATSVIAHIEMPAPTMPRPEDPEAEAPEGFGPCPKGDEHDIDNDFQCRKCGGDYFPF